MKIVHVASAPNKLLEEKAEKYLWYDYKPFIEEDNWSGLFIRIWYFIHQHGADLLVFDFERPDMINENEYAAFAAEIPCVNTRPALPASIMTDAIELHGMVSQLVVKERYYFQRRSKGKAAQQKELIRLAARTKTVIEKLMVIN